MNYRDIIRAAAALRAKYPNSDPEQLAARLKIVLLPQHLGTGRDCIKGFFLECKRIRTITVNVDLPREVQRIIIAHELGHAVLHRRSGVHAFHDLQLFDYTGTCEQEANLFAAELLLPDSEVLSALREGTVYTAAAELCVPPELLDFKLRLLRTKGIALRESPIAAGNRFMKHLSENHENTKENSYEID